MRHPTRTRAPVRWVPIVLFLCLSGGIGLAVSPFDVDLGDGEVGELLVLDEEISHQLDAEAAYTIRYTRWRPASTSNKVIVYNHGLQSHRGWFNATADALRRSGYTVYAFDRIGSGESSDGQSWMNGSNSLWPLFSTGAQVTIPSAFASASSRAPYFWSTSIAADSFGTPLLSASNNPS